MQFQTCTARNSCAVLHRLRPGCRSLCGAIKPNGYGMQECQRCRFRNNASKVTAERMKAKSIQTECKRSLFGKNANGIASERMQTKPLQREGQRGCFRKNADEVAASLCNETDVPPQPTHPRARVRTKSLQKECKRTHAHEGASERKLSRSHQRGCQTSRFRKNSSESIQTLCKRSCSGKDANGNASKGMQSTMALQASYVHCTSTTNG